jgi:hypothetical protein
LAEELGRHDIGASNGIHPQVGAGGAGSLAPQGLGGQAPARMELRQPGPGRRRLPVAALGQEGLGVLAEVGGAVVFPMCGFCALFRGFVAGQPIR